MKKCNFSSVQTLTHEPGRVRKALFSLGDAMRREIVGACVAGRVPLRFPKRLLPIFLLDPIPLIQQGTALSRWKYR